MKALLKNKSSKDIWLFVCTHPRKKISIAFDMDVGVVENMIHEILRGFYDEGKRTDNGMIYLRNGEQIAKLEKLVMYQGAPRTLTLQCE